MREDGTNVKRKFAVAPSENNRYFLEQLEPGEKIAVETGIHRPDDEEVDVGDAVLTTLEGWSTIHVKREWSQKFLVRGWNYTPAQKERLKALTESDFYRQHMMKKKRR